MSEARLTVGDYASPGRGGAQNPCVMGCAHLFLGSLFVLGEGNGGSESGRVESRLAVSAVLADFRGSTTSDPRQRLSEALRHAGTVLHDRARSGPAFQDAHATCVALLVRRGRLYAARAGHVEVHLLRETRSRSLFVSTSGTGEQRRNAALGPTADPVIEVLEEDIELSKGDRLVLGNAALFAALPPDEIARTGASLVPAVAARRLVEAVERSEDPRAVAVQIIQVGEATVMDDLGPKGDEARVPVAPARPVVPQLPRPLPPPTPPAIRAPPREVDTTRSVLPRRPVLVLGLLAVAGLGVLARVIMGNGDEAAPIPDPPAGMVAHAETGSPHLGGSPAGASGFWERVEGTLDQETGELDERLVRSFLSGPGEAQRRLREARAVVAALEGGAEAAESGEDVEASGHEENPGGGEPDPVAVETDGPAPGGEEPEDGPEEAAADAHPPEEPAAAGPAGWDPAKALPPLLRRYDRLFAPADANKAARRLRQYIHMRHDHVDRVLSSLDQYLDLAPKKRSVAVLRAMLDSEPRPGPRASKWARQAISRLNSRP